MKDPASLHGRPRPAGLVESLVVQHQRRGKLFHFPRPVMVAELVLHLQIEPIRAEKEWHHVRRKKEETRRTSFPVRGILLFPARGTSGATVSPQNKDINREKKLG
jgi:hypothetical protein